LNNESLGRGNWVIVSVAPEEMAINRRQTALVAVAVILGLVIFLDERFVVLRTRRMAGDQRKKDFEQVDIVEEFHGSIGSEPEFPSGAQKKHRTIPSPSPANDEDRKTANERNPIISAEAGETTFLQRIKKWFPNATDPYIDQCRASPLPPMRQNLDCETHLTEGKSIYPDFLHSPKRLKRHSEWKWRNVTYLVDADWGFTCNKMEIVGGGIWRMLNNNKFKEAEVNMLALGPLFSELVWQLDLRFISRDFPILIDCVECPVEPDRPQLLRCGALIVDGVPRELDPQDNVFFAHTQYFAVDLYWNVGPSSLGFHPSLAYYMLPSERLRRAVEKAMLGQKQKIVGIHRRDMENWCYRYIGNGRGEYECHINGEADTIISHLVKAETVKRFEKGFYFKPLESEYPWLMVCNYTLDSEQLDIFARVWPSVFEKGKKHHMLFTTDRNDVGGDLLLMTSPVIERLFRIHDVAPDVGCMADKHRMLFYDMYGLALSDVHMGNPLSSCDVTVVHWRKILGKDRESSFPQECYRGYYDDDTHFL
jgi:hypothetical protein